MKKFAVALVSVFLLSATAGAIADNTNSDNKVVAAGKKVGNAIAWPFKKSWEGMKAGWHKISGK